jgi:chromosomal replication initiation ATPase DnaA
MNLKDEEEIKTDWNTLDEKNIESAMYYLRKHEQDTSKYLANCVASLCNIEEKDLLADTNAAHISHARWLYWYAYRYLTNESYAKMSQQLKTDSRTFVGRAIQQGVTKMAMMISNEQVWNRRWNIIKRVIKIRYSDDEKEDNTITINIPKELRKKIKIEIKEK